jgi:hypothetical protein
VRDIRDSHHTAAIVETYRQVTTSSKGGRTVKDIKALRLKYKPGQTIAISDPDSDSDDEPIVVQGRGAVRNGQPPRLVL